VQPPQQQVGPVEQVNVQGVSPACSPLRAL
jgi:hypothetical protein